MVWWGTTEKTVFAVVIYTCFFPIAFNVLTGVRSTPRIYVNALRTLGASSFRIVRDVLLPGAMLAGRRGLGWMIFSAQQADQTAQARVFSARTVSITSGMVDL